MSVSTLSPSSLDDAARSRRCRVSIYALILTVWFAAMTGQISRMQPLLSANDRSRWCTVWSLVERGTYQIDEIDAVPGWSTIDKVRHDGHFYSSKPALFPAAAAGVYWCLKKCTGWTLLEQTELVARVLLVLVNLVPMLIALCLIAAIVERHAVRDFTRYFVLLSAAWGTFLTTFAVTLNNHTVAAVSVVIALYCTMRILNDAESRGGMFSIAGFFAMFACTNELPAALLGLSLFGVLFRRSPKQTLLWFLPAAALPFAAFLFSNWQATGSWKPFYAHYGTEKYLWVVDGIPSYWARPKGIDAITEPTWIYLLHCTVGHHGILSLSPIFLLTLSGWAVGRGGRETRDIALQVVRWLGMVLTIGVLAFYLTRTENYNYGGVTSGLRWMFWLIPLWLVAMIPAIDRWADSIGFRAIAALLLAISVFSAAYPLNNPWQHPWLFSLMEQWGWIDYNRREPPPEFEHPLASWFASLPKANPDAKPAWVEFDVYDAAGGTRRLRLTDGSNVKNGGSTFRKIIVTWNPGRDDHTEALYFVDEESFYDGDPAAKFFHWPSDATTDAQKAAAETFVQGLPAFRPYQPGEIRYLKTPLRSDYFECRKAASRVKVSSEDGSNPIWYRTDLWLNPNVPFGVLRRETSVIDDETGGLLARQVFVVVAASSFPQSADEDVGREPTGADRFRSESRSTSKGPTDGN